MLRQKLQQRMAAENTDITVRTPEENVLENFSRLFYDIFGNYMQALTKSFLPEPTPWPSLSGN